MQEATERQAQVLSYIQWFIQMNGYPPTLRELGDLMGTTYGAAHQNVRALERKGYLTTKRHASRGLTLTRKGGGARRARRRPSPAPAPKPHKLIPRRRCMTCWAVTFAQHCYLCTLDRSP